MKSRYIAIWIVGEDSHQRVFPKKFTCGAQRASTFTSVKSAVNALERKARYCKRDTRGIVKEAITGLTVYTIAL